MIDVVYLFVTEVYQYWSHFSLLVLFFSAFLSATLLPGGSEAALVATLKLGQYPIPMTLLVATLGNALGGAVNYMIGLWLPNRTLQRKCGYSSLQWLEKYGYWALIFSWLPIVGDALCVAAGWLRLSFPISFLFIVVGKALRYIVLAVIFYKLF